MSNRDFSNADHMTSGSQILVTTEWKESCYYRFVCVMSSQKGRNFVSSGEMCKFGVVDEKSLNSKNSKLLLLSYHSR